MKKEELLIRPIEAGVSIIDENPIGVLEKLGKYEFVYDYKIPTFLDSIFTASFTNERASTPNMIAPSGFYSGQSFSQPIKVNSEAQVGFFSKGNIVNVLRFDGNNAIIENINYKAPDPTIVKSVFGEYLGGFLNKKELLVPKDYLRKADDTLDATILTGINYGFNMKPQPIYITPPIKPNPFSPVTQNILEENANFVLSRDFQYVSHYGGRDCPATQMCPEDVVAKYAILKAGTKVTGRLFRETNNLTLYKIQMGGITPPNYNDYLSVKGYGSQGSINIPVDYLTKEVSTNSGAVVPTENNNKNLLIIVGAFLVGYVLFNKQKNK